MRCSLAALRRLWFGSLLLACVVWPVLARAQSFAQPKVIPTGSWPVFVGTEDLNHDGKPDLYYIDGLSASGRSTYHWLKGDGAGGFTQQGASGWYGSSVVMGDFLGLGFQQIATAYNAGPTDPQSTTLRCAVDEIGVRPVSLDSNANPNGAYGAGFCSSGTLPPVLGNEISAVLRSGASPSIVFTDSANNLLYIVDVVGVPTGFGNVTVSVSAKTISLPDGAGPVFLADVNGDGFPDLIVNGQTGLSAQIFLGSANGIASGATPYSRFRGAGGATDIHSMLLQVLPGSALPTLIAETANGHLDFYNADGSGSFLGGYSNITGALNGFTGNGGHLVGSRYNSSTGTTSLLTSTPIGVSAMTFSSGVYGLKGIYNAGPGRAAYAIADFNGDGIADLAVDSPEGIAILYGNADGSFQSSRAFAAGQPAVSGAVGVLTASGHLDAVVGVGLSGTSAQVMLGQGDGTFVATSAPTPVEIVTNHPPLIGTVVVADFDGDGKQDLLISADGGGAALRAANSSGLYIQFGDGAGNFKNAQSLGLPYFPTDCQGQYYGPLFGRAALADFNGDGLADIASRTAEAIRTLNGNTSKYGPALANTVYDNSATCAPHAHDLILGYGRDLLAQRDSSLLLFTNDGKGNFPQTPAGDLSVDGSLTTPGQLTAPNINGTFGGTSSTLGFAAFPGSAVVADLDGDGNNDLIVAYDNLAADHTAPTTANPNYLYLWYGSGGDKFLVSARHPVNPVRITPSRNYYQVAVADLNGDGIPDLILSDGYLISYQFGKGDGTFGAENHVLAGQGINTISLGDLRGTGHRDLIVANGGVTFGNPVANKDAPAVNADVNTGGVTVLLNTASTFVLTVPTGTVAASPEPSVFDSAWTITATLAGTPAPTGTVTFSIDGVAVGTATLAGGTASIAGPVETLPGSHTVTAVYSGDLLYAPATLTGSHTVLRGPTSVILTPTTPYTVYYGQGIDGTFSITVVDPANYPYTGNYSVSDNGVVVPYCASLPPAQGCPYGAPNLLDAGTHALTIQYLGDPVNAPSDSPQYVFTILPDLTTAGVLTSSKNPANQGDAVTFTVTLTGNIAVPTGSVSFLDGTTVIGTGGLNGSGTASFTTSALAVGTHPIKAAYAGNIDFNAVSSAAISQVILPVTQAATSAIALVSSVNPSTFGQAVSFTATVTTGTAGVAPTGTVTFYDGMVSLSQVPLNANGVAVFTTAALAVGSHPLSASYSGAAGTVLSSASAVLVQVVGAPAVTGTPGYTLSVTPNPLSLGVGRTGILKVTITATGGFSQAVALTCTGVPPESACVFLSPTITGGGVTTLDLMTSAPRDCGSNTPYFLGQNEVPRWPAGVVAAGLVLIAVRRKRLRGLLLLAVAGLALAGVSGCGHCTDLGTKPGNYTFTVVATPQGGPVTGVQSAVIQLQMTIPH